eukprot:g48232.t1
MFTGMLIALTSTFSREMFGGMIDQHLRTSRSFWHAICVIAQRLMNEVSSCLQITRRNFAPITSKRSHIVDDETGIVINRKNQSGCPGFFLKPICSKRLIANGAFHL